MKKAFSILMLLVAMLVAWPARAQLQLTVANGTTTNEYVPIYGYYADAYLRAQMIYPGSDLATMTGGVINSMTFYANSSADWGSVTFQVKVGTTSASSLSSWSSAPLTTVYTGIPSLNSSNQMVINFTTPYVYTGGNLLVEFVSTSVGSYEHSYWYGISSTGSSVQGYDYDYPSSIDADQQNFLPKVTFSYAPGNRSCPMPFGLTATNISYHDADIVWRDTANTGSYRLWWAPVDTLSHLDSVDVYDTTWSLSNLGEGVDYLVRVASLCPGEESYKISTTFRTDAHVIYYNMTQTFDSIRTCNAYIYDNGGPTGNYSNNANNTLVVRANSNDSVLVLSGTASTESGWDYLYIYDGVGTSGTQLLNPTSGSGITVGPFTSLSGAFTIVFTSDVSGQYSGFELHAQCAYIPCPTPFDATLDSVGLDWAAVSWQQNGTAYSWVVEYDTVPFTPGTNQAFGSETAYDNNILLQYLDSARIYYMSVHADCGGDTSENILFQFNTLAGAPATVPYNCTFENGTGGWEFVYGGQTNYWMIGTATNHGGNNSMYVTNDSSSNSYSTSNISFSYAYRTLNLNQTGEYIYSFDWKCYGEGSYDYIRAWLAPASFEFTAGQTPDGGTSAYSYTSSNPTGWIPLDGGSKLNLQSSWQTRSNTFQLTQAGLYNLIFMWANDGSGGSNPPAAIDNIMLIMNTCPTPYGLTASNVGSDEATLTWHAGGTETLWYVSDGINEDIAYDTTYTFYGMTPDSNYSFTVRAICDVDDTSLAIHTTAHTLPTCPAPTGLVLDSVGVDWAALSWTQNGTAASSWVVEYDSVNFTPGTGSHNVVNVNSTDIFLTNLDTNQTYYVYVHADCSVETSTDVSLNFRTLASEAATVPYLCTFEGSNTNGWEFANGSQTNYWMVGTATNNGGSKSMYITNNGSSYNYNTSSSASYVFAYRIINLTQPGEYIYSFDWKAYGESSYDFIRVALVPVNVELTAGSYCGFNNTTGVPAGSIALDGGRLNLQSSWQTRTGTFNLTQAGAYKLTFLWRNDGSGGSNPPAAIDNVILSRITCPAPFGLTASNITTDQVTLTWNAGGSESLWLVSDGTNEDIAYDTTYTFFNLNADQNYTFTVRALCDVDDTSMMIVTNARTLQTCARPYNFATTQVWGDTVDVSWTDTTNSGSYDLAFGPAGFDPDTAIFNYVSGITTTTYQFTGLTIGNVYQFYVRTNCTNGYTSTWEGPISATPSYSMNMATTGSNTVYNACGFTIYDDGGASGNYGNSCSSTLTLYPNPGSLLRLYGNNNLESCCDHLYIYDGASTSGTLLFSSTGTNTIDTLTSTSGPLTISFTSDGSLVYSGFELHTFCTAAPLCPRVAGLMSTGNTTTSLTFDWMEMGTATEWEVCFRNASTTTPTADTTIYTTPGVTFTGLTAGTTYYVWVRPVCTSDSADWMGPVTAVPGQWIMHANQTDTVHMCGGVIYDDGGATGEYSSNQSSTLIIQPDTPGSLVSLTGTAYIEGNGYDILTIYDGVGTSGAVLLNLSSSDYSDGTPVAVTSNSGPLTLFFESDYSDEYDGFALNVTCQSTYCRITNLQLNPTVPASASQLALTWDNNGANVYEVEYGTPGFTPGTGILLTTPTNSIVIAGLNGLTNYEIHVRSICGASDTGNWASIICRTEMCDNVVIAESWDSTMSSSTSGYAPVGYSLYDYSYVQTLIDSTRFANMTGDITAFAFKPESTTSSDMFTNMTVYMANVPETNLSSGPITPNTTDHQFVKVIDNGNLCFTTTDWQLFSFDSAFTWDGHSNVLVAIKRDHGDWSSSCSFAVHSTTGVKTRYYYQDDTPISYTNPSATSSGTGEYVGDLRFYSCGAAGCGRPIITSTTYTYQSATVTWNGSGSAYEVAIKAVSNPTWPAEIAVNTNSYTFTGLQPATAYQIRVRQDCRNEGLDYSNWTVTTFTTDSLPCVAPTNLTTSNITNAQATFSWTPVGNETAWDLHVFNPSFDTTYLHVTHPATVGGFTAGVTYYASVRALCGTAQNIEGMWGDTIQFTAAVCADVTGLATGNVTFNSVALSWNSVPGAIGYRLVCRSGQYFDTIPMVATNSYTFLNLEPETPYQFSVQTICGTGWYAENFVTVSATTLEEPEDVVVLNLAVNDASMGYVTVNGTETTIYRGALNEQVTLAAWPFEGYEFVNWSDGETAATRSYTLTSASATLTANFRQLEGIGDVATARCDLYPNPAKGVTTVSVTGISGKVRIAVLDLSGREMLSETVECAADCEKHLDIEGLAEGAYFVRITSEVSEPMVKKLIVR